MAWTRIDDEFKSNLKIRKAGGDGVLLYIYGLVHCNTKLTNGYIDEAYLPQLYADAFCKSPKITLKKLVDLGLWLAVLGGYEINDFLLYNLSKSQVEERRESKIDAGRTGGHASGQSRRQAKSEAQPQADAQASAQAQPQAETNPITHNPLPITQNPKKTSAAAGFSTNPELYQLFEDGISAASKGIKKRIDDAVEVHSFGWVRDAITEGINGKAKSFAYIETVLSNWKINGKTNSNGRKKAHKVETGADLGKFKKLYQSQEA